MNSPCYTLSQHWDRDQDRQNDADAELEAARQEADSFSFGPRHKFTNTRLGVPMTTDIKAKGMEWMDRAIIAENRVAELEGQLSAQTEQTEICTGCNGRGEVGGLTMEGYQSEPCPYCKQAGAA